MKNDLMEKTRNIIKTRRIRALNEYERRVAEVTEKVPQFAEINKTLYDTSRQIMQLISSNNNPDEVNQKIGMLKYYNLTSQKMSADYLKNNGFPENYLDIPYECKKCSDTGFIHGNYCDCFNKVYQQLAVEDMNKNVKMNLTSFDTFDLSYYKGSDRKEMEETFSRAVKYAEDFGKEPQNLLLFGETGLGKTHISLAIANEVIKKGFSVFYDSTINILKNMEKEYYSYEFHDEYTSMIMDSDLLILDDLGTEYTKPVYTTLLYNIINSRINSSKSTIISTNFGYKFIAKYYDERIVSRLQAMYQYLKFKGEDVRLQISRNRNYK